MLQREADNPGIYTSEVDENGLTKLDRARIAYENYNVDKATEDFVNSATEEGRKIFIENMTTAFGSAVEKLNEKGFRTDLLTTGPGGLAEGNRNRRDWGEENLAMNLGWNPEEFKNVLDLMDISGMDMVTDKMKSMYISRIIKVFGRGSDTYSRLKDELNIPVDEILALDKQSWDSWEKKTQKNYIAALAEAYGGREVIEGFKKAGYSAEQLLWVISEFNGNTKESLINAIEEVYGGKITITKPVEVEPEVTNTGLYNPPEGEEYKKVIEAGQNKSWYTPPEGEEKQKVLDAANNPWWQFEPPTGEDYEKIMEAAGVVYVNPHMMVEPEFEIVVDEEKVRSAIQEALQNDSLIDPYEMENLNKAYGNETVNRIMNELLDEGMNPDGTFGKGVPTAPLRMSAAGMGYSDIPRSGGPYVTGGQVVVEEKDNAQEVTNIANGVERGNSNMTSVMNAILSVVQAISRKDTTVVVSPSSGWGMFNERANSMAARVKG